MNFLERFLLPALCLATVVASAAAVLTLDRYGVFALASAGDDRAAGRTSNAAAREDSDAEKVSFGRRRHEDEIAFVAPHVVALLPTLSDHSLREAAADENAPSWALDDWTTETRRAAAAPAAGPRLSVAPVERLPWRGAAPDAAAKKHSLAERLAEISPEARKRLVTKFLAANAVWPPADIGLVAIKDQKITELHARPQGGEWKLVHQYRVLAASGASGPKLRQGDRQVPEGVYGISFLNPNSRYHVALRVDYPNAFDRRMAATWAATS